MLESLIQDLRYAARSLRQHPLFTAIAVLTLGLGIGANTAIFSVLDAVVLRPLSYDRPEQLVEVGSGAGGAQQLSFPNLRDVRTTAHSFSQLAAFRYWLFNLSGSDHPQSLLGVYVGDSLFSTLRVRPMLGRTFAPGVESPNYPREAVVSYGLWQRRFGADPRAVGTTAVIDGVPTTIIGVLPQAFRFPDLVPASAPLPSRAPDLYLPVGTESQPDFDQRGNNNYTVIGRMAPGVTLPAASADLARVAAIIAHDHPGEAKHFALAAVPLQQEISGDVRRPLTLLFGAVALVLLIACANVGGLLLARAMERRREIGIRTALGASPIRLARQLLTESLLLAMLGGVLGVGLASWGVALLRVVAPATLPRIDEIALDGRVLLFALIGSLVTGVLFGLAPVFQQRSAGPALVLRESGRGTSATGTARRLRSGLVVAEVALAVVLLTGAGLLFRSFELLSGVNPGFDGAKVMTMFTLLPPSRYPDAAHMAAFEHRVLADLNNLPGVASAAAVNTLPMSNLGDNTTADAVGHVTPVPADRPHVGYRILGGRYFQTMGMSMAAGREFVAGDTAGAPPVVILNQAAARRLLPGEDPIGKQLILYNGDVTPKTVVGVVTDVHGVALDSAADPEISTPYAQGPDLILSLAIRTRGDPRALLPQIRHALGAIDPDQAFYAERTMGDLLSASLAIRRFDLRLLGGFAALALILAAVGLYGVIAFSVSQRTREIGIRAALGAERGMLARLVLREGAMLGGFGLAIGVVVSIGATRLMRGLLYQVGTVDPVTYAGVLVFLAAIVLGACYLPARRAARIDPIEALRE